MTRSMLRERVAGLAALAAMAVAAPHLTPLALSEAVTTIFMLIVAWESIGAPHSGEAQEPEAKVEAETSTWVQSSR